MDENKAKELETRIEKLERKQQKDDWNDHVMPVCIAVLTFWASCVLAGVTIEIIVKIVSS